MWVKQYIQESTALDELANLIVSANKGWQRVRDFWLVSINSYLTQYGTTVYTVDGVRHIILQKGDHDFLGFAQPSNTSSNLTTKPSDVQAISIAKANKPNDTRFFYCYMLEKLPPYEEDTLISGYGADTLNVEGNDPYVMQSPYVRIDLRTIDGNWWPDSKIAVEGSITDKHIFLSLVSDTLPLWVNNSIPEIPFFYGEIDSYDPNDTRGNRALFAGSVSYGDTIMMPPSKTYPSQPSNGLSSVMVKRGIRGGYYQKHYLSWNTAPNLMPETRESYPRKWHTRHDHKTYLTQFSPSRYTGKVHTSCLYVIHPEEGVRGKLADVIAVSPVSLMNGDRLIVSSGSEAGTYRFHLFEGNSVLTKSPGSAYQPVGIGMKILNDKGEVI